MEDAAIVSEDEALVRTWRNVVYDQASTDSNWANCRENWLKPGNRHWLMQEFIKQHNNNNRVQAPPAQGIKGL